MLDLTEDQLLYNKSYYTFGENYGETQLKTPKCSFANVTISKRKLLQPFGSEERLKDTPTILSLIPTNRAKKVQAAKEVFSNIIKQILPESYKKFKITYDDQNNLNDTVIIDYD